MLISRVGAQRRVRSAVATLTLASLGVLTMSVAAGGPASAGKADTGGTLRYGMDLTVSGVDKALDPVRSRAVSDFVHMNLIYDTLLKAQDDGTYKPGLAESYKVEGNNSVTIKLRPNLKFTDNTPLDANAVKFTIERNVAARNTNFAPEINNVQSVEVIDPLTVKITLKTPTIGSFFELLAGRETMPVSPTAVQADPNGFNTKPVGAGPMIVTQFTPQSILSLRANPGYYGAKKWKLAGVDFVHAVSGAPRVNAFRAKQVDMIELDAGQSQDLKGVANTQIKTTPSDANFIYLATCKSRPPFDNLTFRQAVQYAIDRDAVNQVLLDGEGQPMWTMWPEGSAYFTKSTRGKYAYSVKKAKKLFKEAGWNPNDTLQVGYSAPQAQLKTWAEIFQSQMADAGVKVELVPMQDIVTQFYRNAQTPAAVSLWIRPGLQKVTRAFGPNSVANVCNYSDPELDQLTAQIAALPPGDPQLKKLWDQVNTKITDELLWNFAVWQPLVHAWNSKKVTGVTRVSPLLQGPDFSTISVKR